MGDTTEAGDSIEPADGTAEALAAIRFDRDGLVPAVAQQYDTGEDPDGGVDEPRCRTGDPHRGASLLLVTVARKAMAKGRNLRPSAATA